MARSIYITSAEGHSGKSTIALGVLDSLSRVSPRVGVFRTIARSVTEPDYVLEMLLDHDGTDLDYADCIGVTYDDVRADPEGALAEIVARFKRVEDRCDAVVVLGSDYTDVGKPCRARLQRAHRGESGTPPARARRAKAAGALPELGPAAARSPRDVEQLASLAVAELGRANAELAATIVNRADVSRAREIVDAVRERTPGSPVWAIPEDRLLVAPTMADILRSVDGEVVKGDDALLAREALWRDGRRDVDGQHPPAPRRGARRDHPRRPVGRAALATLTANSSGIFPSLAGIVLNGDFDIPNVLLKLIEGLASRIPIIRCSGDTYSTPAVRVVGTRGRLAASSPQRYTRALSLFLSRTSTSRNSRGSSASRGRTWYAAHVRVPAARRRSREPSGPHRAARGR